MNNSGLVCFLCNRKFTRANVLMKHLSSVKTHNLNQHSQFKCAQENCNREYTNSRCFVRHLKKEHPQIEQVDWRSERLHVAPVDMSATGASCLQNEPEAERPSTYQNCDVIIDNDIEPEGFWQNIEKELDDELLSSIQKTGTAFTIFLHSLPNYNRAMVFEVIASFKNMVLEPLTSIVSEAIGPFIPENDRAATLNNLMKITQVFDAVNTEHKFVKLLKEECDFKMPMLNQVNNELIPVEIDDGVEMIEKSKSNVYIGLERFFSTFFSIDANIETLLDNHQQTYTTPSTDLIDNFVKATFWRQKIKDRSDQICIPYFIFADSFEINNPLGSKAGKQALTGFYLNFPSLPRHIHGTIENMFLIQFVYSAVEKSFSNEEVLNILIQEISYLEKTPLKFRVKGVERNIFFLFGGLRGDNLGLNSLLDYSKSFVANHPCRICSMNLENIRVCTVDDANLYRTEESYSLALQIDRFSETGIRKNSIFNTIPDFHVTDLKTVDCMHDFFEGFAHDALACCINRFISNGYFSLFTLNQRVQRFDYDINERKNIPPEIKQESLDSLKFKMSAGQMKSFVDNVTLMIGDLVPAGDEWTFLINVTKLGSLVMKPSFTTKEIKDLKHLIHCTLSQYKTLFDKHLKPKAHFLTHYPLAIEWTGPLRFTSTFIPEMKHKYFKKIASTTSSRKNIAFTLAIKDQFKMAHKVYTRTHNFGPLQLNEGTGFFIKLDRIPIPHELVSGDGGSIVRVLNYVMLGKTKIKSGTVLIVWNQNMILKEVRCIVKNSDGIVFICHTYQAFEYDEHIDGYVIDPRSYNIDKCRIEDITHSPTHLHHLPDGRKVIRLRH